MEILSVKDDQMKLRNLGDFFLKSAPGLKNRLVLRQSALEGVCHMWAVERFNPTRLLSAPWFLF